MSSDEKKQNRNEPVDIDQLEVSIFIIAKKPDQLKSSVQFLTRRGWPTSCIGNISKAIGTIVNESPDIVLISVDHPNPNVARLPILLGQSLNTLCVGFAEDGGAISINKLNKSRYQNKFTGFPSGPSIHRYIRQLLDQKYNPQESEAQKNLKKKNNASGDNSTIQIKGSKGDKAVNVSGIEQSGIMNKNSGSRTKLKDVSGAGTNKKTAMDLSAAEMLQKLSQGDNYDSIKQQNNRLGNDSGSSGSGSNTDGVESSSSDSGSYYQDVLKNSGTELSEEEKKAKKERVAAKKKSFAWQKNQEKEANPIKNQKNRPGAEFDLSQKRNKHQPDSDEPLVEESNKTESSLNMQKGIKSKTGTYVPEAEEKGKTHPAVSPGLEGKAHSATDSGESDKLNKKMSEEKQSGDDTGSKQEADNLIDLSKSKNELGEDENENSGIKKKRISSEVVAKGKNLSPEEDKFKESVHLALKESCEEPDESVLIEIEEIEQIGVIPVDSQKVHGYFLVGRGGIGFSLGTIFLDILSEAVEKHLALQGIDIHCQKPFLVETDNFDFGKMSKNIENFTLFEQSGREEIAVTFVPTKDRIPHLVDSIKSPNMAKISVDHLSTTVPVSFDSFIHLEKNGRFYKYLKSGSKILPRQKEKLMKSEERSGLHINKSEFQKFKKYVAEIMVKQLIEKVNNIDDDGDSSGEAA